jgi:hypothetical protein
MSEQNTILYPCARMAVPSPCAVAEHSSIIWGRTPKSTLSRSAINKWFTNRMRLSHEQARNVQNIAKSFAAASRKGASSRGVAREAVSNLRTTINASRWILDLEEDWDEQGSLGYSELIWGRATDFLVLIAEVAVDLYGRELPMPEILPGPDQSIDLHWKSEGFELLVNIPDDHEKAASFYGDNYGELSIKGTFKPEKPNRGLVAWLVNS